MKSLLIHLRPAIASTLIFAVVLCGLYPVVVWGISQVAFKDKANGSLITDAAGTIRGSTLLGQGFIGEGYLRRRLGWQQSRPHFSEAP